MYTGQQNSIENVTFVQDDAFERVHDYLLVSEQCSWTPLEKQEDPDPSTDYKGYNQNAYKGAPSSVSQVSAPFTSTTLQSRRAD